MTEVLDRLARVEVAIAAPCPLPLEINNGWLDRIRVIDDILAARRRVYVNFAPHHTRPIAEAVVTHRDGVYEVYVNPEDRDHQAFVAAVAERVKLVYVHTLHYAEYVIDLLGSGKIAVDIHGITPEEEEMLGRPELRPRYEAVEKNVLAHARCCVMVSKAMQAHYLAKYPGLPREGISIVLPIVQSDEPDQGRANDKGQPELPVRVLYSGGTQRWQNIPAMLGLAAASRGHATFKFLSQDWQQIRDLASQRSGLDGLTFASATKDELAEHYRQADFGMALRDPMPVNTVACPTKLFDYMNYGVIPIVRTPHLGDFETYGYRYVTEGDFVSGYFPDRETRTWMRIENHAVVKAMRADFDSARQQLEALLRGYLGG